MPELDFMILADYAQMDRGKLHLLGAGIDSVSAGKFPSSQMVGIGLRILMSRAEAGRTFPLELIFQDADGGRLVQVDGELRAEIPPESPPGSPIGVGMAINMPVPLTAPGAYSFVLIVGDAEKKHIDVRVVQRTPESPRLPA